LAASAAGAIVDGIADDRELAEVPRDPLTRRDLAVGGFRFHATAFMITNAMALATWVVITLLGEGAFFFPIIPLALWTPLLALHAYSLFRSVPGDADEPLQLPFVIERRSRLD